MTVHLIWAEANNRVIGANGTLPWHLPEDLRLFRQHTHGAVVVMGRRTWESLPDSARPLPGRTNVVLTHRQDLPVGAIRANSVAEVIEQFDDFWVIGGSTVYETFMPFAEHIVRTRIRLDVNGDVHAPTPDHTWVTTNTSGWNVAENGIEFTVEHLNRTLAPQETPEGATQ